MSKKPLKFIFAVMCGKITIKLLRLLKKNGTNFPGSVVLKICPDFLRYIDKPEKIFCCENEDDIADYIDLNADTTYIMFDMFNQHLRYSAEESVKKRLENL